MDKNEHPPLGTVFLTYGGYGTEFNESLVINSLRDFFEKFETKPLWAWVHPSNEEKAQGIISELGGKLQIEVNGGTSVYHFWLAMPIRKSGNGSQS